jgi:hypothetical protein
LQANSDNDSGFYLGSWGLGGGGMEALVV